MESGLIYRGKECNSRFLLGLMVQILSGSSGVVLSEQVIYGGSLLLTTESVVILV